MKTFILDCETYRDYFLVALLDVDTDDAYCFEVFDWQTISHRNDLIKFMKHSLTIGFNSVSYDLPLIYAALQGKDNGQLYSLSNNLISNSYQKRDVPEYWNHVDLINVAPGQSSLKVYGGRLHAPKLQDLPYKPTDSVTPSMRDELKRYCVNDLMLTKMLYLKLKKAIDLRTEMSKQYGIDLRSKSDAQIAETVIKSELESLTGKTYRKPPDLTGKIYKYQDPKIITFKAQQLNDLLDGLLKADFIVQNNGGFNLPEGIGEPVCIAGKEYRVGIGGLHSCETSQALRSDDETLIMDLDVASYYPSIILQQKLAPKSLGEPFLKVYKQLVERRLSAKREGRKTEADSLKIAVNGSFGKLGSKFSFLYSPDLMIQVTITGQLALLMLIERLTDSGIAVMSANTDGILIKCKKDQLDTLDEVAWEWQMDTTYFLERTDYKLIASRDVNNYFAIGTDGKIKGKGLFAGDSLMKNPDRQIIPESVVQTAIGESVSVREIRDYICNCKDITKFTTLRTVKGGALWKGELLGKTVRFYTSKDFEKSAPITYQTTGNKVPKSQGSMPLMQLPSEFPDDVDLDSYVVEAEKLRRGVGL